MSQHPRILVFEPNPESRDMIEKVLGRHCDLYFGSHPLQIFDLLEVFEPDLLVLELELDGLDGFELISLVQAQPVWRGIPIMVFSTRSDAATQKQAYRMGAMHFQSKIGCQPSQLFKAATMFWRLAPDHAPYKQYPIDEIESRLDERIAAHEPNPVLSRMMAAQSMDPSRGLVPTERRMIATIGAAWPI